jgi:RimJ/RimL family protein N-acetyltransferase
MFNEIGITEIRTSAAEINTGSWKLMEKLGFKCTGQGQSTYFKDDEILPSKLYYCNKEMFLNRGNKGKVNQL